MMQFLYFSDRYWCILQYDFFFYLGFLSRIFTNHRTAGEGEEHFFNSSLPLLPPASQTLRHQSGEYCRELTSDLSNSRTRTANFWFSSASRKPLCYTPQKVDDNVLKFPRIYNHLVRLKPWNSCFTFRF